MINPEERVLSYGALPCFARAPAKDQRPAAATVQQHVGWLQGAVSCIVQTKEGLRLVHKTGTAAGQN